MEKLAKLKIEENLKETEKQKNVFLNPEETNTQPNACLEKEKEKKKLFFIVCIWDNVNKKHLFLKRIDNITDTMRVFLNLVNECKFDRGVSKKMVNKFEIRLYKLESTAFKDHEIIKKLGCNILSDYASLFISEYQSALDNDITYKLSHE